jgi:two-component system, NarL family, response regulator LiaR
MREDGLSDSNPGTPVPASGPSLRERIQQATDVAAARPVIRLMVVDDSEIIRVGLVQMLTTFAHFEVVGQANEGQQAVELCCQQGPDVVLMDILMPRLNGIEATRQIRTRCPETRVIALTISDDPIVIEQMLQAGAISYLLKTVTAVELVEAIVRAHAGQATLVDQVVDVLGRLKTRRPRTG